VGLYDKADGLSDALASAHVQTATAKEYEKRVKKGGAVVLVRAGLPPAWRGPDHPRRGRRMGAVDMGEPCRGGLCQRGARAVLELAPARSSPLLTRNRVPGSTTYHMANWPIPLISRRKPMTESIIEPHAYMADKPIGHLVPHETATAASRSTF
jgi:hypothetical protein